MPLWDFVVVESTVYALWKSLHLTSYIDETKFREKQSCCRLFISLYILQHNRFDGTWRLIKQLMITIKHNKVTTDWNISDTDAWLQQSFIFEQITELTWASVKSGRSLHSSWAVI